MQHSGFAPDFDKESADLAAGRPNVQNVTFLFEKWWGSGVLHAKVWISDKKDMYIGSANNDWKSLTQVYWTERKLYYIFYLQSSVDCGETKGLICWHYFYLHCRSRSLGFILLIVHK